MISYEDVTEEIIAKEAYKIYPYGSRVYHTANENSDYDYLIVLKPDSTLLDNKTNFYTFWDRSYHLYSCKNWMEGLKEGKINLLEAYFCSSGINLIEPIDVNKDLIRESVSATASNSFVKCKKKLYVPEDYDPYIGRKSLWHSLRLFSFGIQLMEANCIYDYTVANKWYDDVVNIDHPGTTEWAYLKEKYQPIYNKLHTDFKIAHNTHKSELIHLT